MGVYEAPSEEIKRLAQYYQWSNDGLILGCDAYSHHTLWRRKDINNRGECLLESLTQHGIDYINNGKKTDLHIK